ncbi:hypothetical protein CWI39_3251p0010 [Hamiltosporidium magnivora]|uniref:Uncharacterized protein n=1 Tax=Hamiltosporidium magnivora TaxID=148818 RepID=A0A4Q9KSS7_9MICR|nr:hypothetical protein CWI39_3251p0010 [Hamiltosporidium magnivora]
MIYWLFKTLNDNKENLFLVLPLKYASTKEDGVTYFKTKNNVFRSDGVTDNKHNEESSLETEKIVGKEVEENI